MNIAHGARGGQWPGQGAGPERGTIRPLFLRPPGACRPRGNEGEPASSPHPPGRPCCQGPADARAGLRRGAGGAACPTTLWPSTAGCLRGACTSASPRPPPPAPCPARATGSVHTPLILSPPGPRRTLAACLAGGGEGRGPLRCERRGLPSILRQPSLLACSLARRVG